MPAHKNTAAATLFYSYAHVDEAFREQLEKHLSLLRREGLLSDWHDRAILPGAAWADEIDEHLEQADLILLLVSADFLASDYCYEIEMARALERHQRGEAHVIPVILRPCAWSSAPFARLQALPRNAQPITTWHNQDEAFTQIVQALRRLLTRRLQVPTYSTAATAQRNRARMIQRLHQWYQDYLSASLQQAVWLELGLTETPQALYNPVTLTLQGVILPDQPLPPGTSIVQVYEQAQGELLLLGEPGSGKSTLLYTLAQHLLQQAETDAHAPLPFVLALSSWAERQDPLPTWMAEQLTRLYQVPKPLAQHWVEQEQILPLLDGLDEMPEAVRPRCIEAINAYHQEHLSPLVVCCRTAEYQTSIQRGVPFALQRAVTVQPLSQQQITTTLAQGGRALTGLRAAYQQNAALQELATVPLLLNLLLLTYQGTSVQELPTRSTALQQQVLQTYVTRMIARKGNPVRYPLEQTTRWLTFLAAQMRAHNLTTCAIEDFQPDWLPPSR
jgi:GTPase SAR1 family protein